MHQAHGRCLRDVDHKRVARLGAVFNHLARSQRELRLVSVERRHRTSAE
jgi:hypothetical protein